jgi:hypothetical protein
VHGLRCEFDNERMDLAGLEPATSGVLAGTLTVFARMRLFRRDGGERSLSAAYLVALRSRSKNGRIRSIGAGKMIVDALAPPISSSVCR